MTNLSVAQICVQWHINNPQSFDFLDTKIDWQKTLELAESLKNFEMGNGKFSNVFPIISKCGKKLALHFPKSRGISDIKKWIDLLQNFSTKDSDNLTLWSNAKNTQHMRTQSTLQSVASQTAIGTEFEECFVPVLATNTSRINRGPYKDGSKYKQNDWKEEQKFLETSIEVGILSKAKVDRVKRCDRISPVFMCDVWVDYVTAENLFMRETFSDVRLQTTWRISTVYKLLKAFNFLHTTCRIVHHDVSGSNIGFQFVDNVWKLLIMDFGFSTTLDRSKACKRSRGTPYYVSPQILFLETHDDEKSEAFSVGVVAFLFLYSRLCWPAQIVRSEQLKRAHLELKKGNYFVWNRITDAGDEFNKFVQNDLARLLRFSEKERPTLTELCNKI